MHSLVVTFRYLKELERAGTRKSHFFKRMKNLKNWSSYASLSVESTSNEHNSQVRINQVCYKIMYERSLIYLSNAAEVAQFRVHMNEICSFKVGLHRYGKSNRILEGQFDLFLTQLFYFIQFNWVLIRIISIQTIGNPRQGLQKRGERGRNVKIRQDRTVLIVDIAKDSIFLQQI